MQYLVILLLAAAVFGICFLVDKAYAAAFRSKRQHRSGKAVRRSKRYASLGLIVGMLGLACLFAGQSVLLYIAGGILVATAVLMVGMYLTFGIFYDDRSARVERFGKKALCFDYSAIRGQNAFAVSGNIVVELYLQDGVTLTLDTRMDGMVAFLDYALENWCKARGVQKEELDFYKREEFSWFPPVGEEN